LVCFEAYFKALKGALERPKLFETWPDFEPVHDDDEYSWKNVNGVGLALILNCGSCDGPCDPRHPRCKTCFKIRHENASEKYREYMGRERGWDIVILFRIYGDNHSISAKLNPVPEDNEMRFDE